MANRTPLLDRQTLLVKVRSGLMAQTDSCDLLEPEYLKTVGLAAHESATLSNTLRPLVGPALVTTVINVYDPAVSLPVLTVRRKSALRGGGLEFLGSSGQVIATGRVEAWSLGAGIDFLDGFGHRLGSVKGDWKQGNFTFTLEGGRVLGVVTRPSSGPPAPVTASLHPDLEHPRGMSLLLGAALALDLEAKKRR